MLFLKEWGGREQFKTRAETSSGCGARPVVGAASSSCRGGHCSNRRGAGAAAAAVVGGAAAVAAALGGAVQFRGVAVVLVVGTVPATEGAAGAWTSHLRLRRRMGFGAAA
ncbi:hypothetical protein NL676_039561 [Syzygium grande]|nr:hypothetical protein NL676_039561 [Syzygium grande]